jgi:hypothetical protein
MNGVIESLGSMVGVSLGLCRFLDQALQRVLLQSVDWVASVPALDVCAVVVGDDAEERRLQIFNDASV